jgi:hypothetical protein
VTRRAAELGSSTPGSARVAGEKVDEAMETGIEGGATPRGVLFSSVGTCSDLPEVIQF